MSWLCRVQMRIPLYNISSNQSVTNTLYFAGSFGTHVNPGVVDAPVPNHEAAIATGVVNAYNALATFRSGNGLSTAEITMYDMSDVEPRVPIYQQPATISAGGGTAYPGEVALCLSYASSIPSGVERRRYRGRMYLGPLNTGAATGGTAATPVRPAGGWTAVLNNYIAALLAIPDTGGGDPVVWSMWSPTDANYRFINKAWYDDAFDTQRGRGVFPTVKTNLTV